MKRNRTKQNDDHAMLAQTKLICGPSRERLLAMLSPAERRIMGRLERSCSRSTSARIPDGAWVTASR